MRGTGKWWVLVGGVGLFAVALLVVGRLAGGAAAPTPRSTGPVVVVLLPGIGGSQLVVTSLETGKVERRIALRSLATDIAVDASTGLVVAAQSGGIGASADDALSVTDVRTGEVRYVTLPVPDPGDVVCLGGSAFVLHSVVEAEGSVVSVVDVGSGTVVGSGHIDGCAGLWSTGAGALWTTVGEGERSPALSRIGQQGLAATRAILDGPPVFGIAVAGDLIAILGPGGPAHTSGAGLVRLFDPEVSSVVASAHVTVLSRAPQQAVTVGSRLVVGDWSGDEPEERLLEVFDASTLRSLGTMEVDGVPCALASRGDRLLVVDREGGRLLVVDPADGRTVSVTDLGERDLVFSDVVVVGERVGAD